MKIFKYLQLHNDNKSFILCNPVYIGVIQEFSNHSIVDGNENDYINLDCEIKTLEGCVLSNHYPILLRVRPIQELEQEPYYKCNMV